jgi:hypothetical protein
MKLFYGISLLIIVYIVAWHQLYGQFVSEYFKKHQNILILLSLPCTWMSIYAIQLITEYFEGEMWPNRILTFSIGIVMFTVLTTIYFSEELTTKTLTLIGLSALIVILQVFWK